MEWENKPYIQFPARHGYVWNEAEIKALKQSFARGYSIAQLARKHKRTVKAIECALNIFNSIEIGDDLIINGTNYTKLFDRAKIVIRYKIYLTSVLGLDHG